MPGEDIFTLAQALFQEPGLRHELRRSPVPDDIDRLLALVGHDRQLLEQRARALRTEPAQLQRIARFYVQEVLLFPDADDQRLLGAPAGADAATLKRHHRLLQSWLHPDRADPGSGEAIHSARINAAFQRLRRLPPADAAGAGGSDAPAERPVRVRHWVRVEDRPQAPTDRRFRRATPVLVLALVGGGAWMVWPSAQAPDPAYREVSETESAPGTARAVLAGVGAGVDGLPAEPAGAGAGTAQAPDAPTASPDSAALTPAPAAPLDQDLVPSPPAAPAPPQPQTGTPAPRVAPVAVAAADRPRAPIPQAPPAAAGAPSADSAAAPSAVLATLFAAPSAAEAVPDPHRVRQAERRGGDLLAWLTRPASVPPPIWRSGQALDSAEAVRRELAGGPGASRPQVLRGQARWRIEPERAQLQVPVQAAGDGAMRLLQAQLDWRDQEWWVESVSLDPRTEPDL